MPKISCKPILRSTISLTRKILGTQQNLMKKIEETVKELPLDTKVFRPVFAAKQEASVWKQGVSKQLEKIAGNMDAGAQENVLSAILGDKSSFFTPSAAEAASGAQLRKLWKKILRETSGLSKADAERFIAKDFAALRAANGDINRFAGTRNSYPKSFHPLFDDILNGGLNTTSGNAYGVTWDLIHQGERVRWLRPAVDEARKFVASIEHMPNIAKDDRLFAMERAAEFLDHVGHQRDTQIHFMAETLGTIVNGINKKIGRDQMKLTNDDINRWAANMASWYSGSAMAFRPALAVRNMSQLLLPMSIVGYGRGARAISALYGKDGKKNIERALRAQNIPLEGGQVFLGEGEGALRTKFGRAIKRFQDTGMIPFKWADRVNNRAGTFLMGEMAIKDEAPLLASKKIDWEMFMLKTGLKGMSPVDQGRIKSLLIGVEHPNVDLAAKEFGKTLVQNTQFIYDGINSPAAFRGTVGRMFGQFGTWPLSFAELAHQNLVASGSWAYRQKVLGNWAVGKTALLGLGISTGVDTSTWNFSNPLTFQGGPWYQGFRDLTILGTSQNEFELRQARGTLNRMVGITGTPWASVLNPAGSAVKDLMQAHAARGNPVEAAILAFGFNTRSNKPATRR